MGKPKLKEMDELLQSHSGQLADIAINVKSYGAKGDGVTDDTQAFISAVNVANAVKGTLKIPKGTYYITTGINIACNIDCDGLIITPDNLTTDVFTIVRNNVNATNVSPTGWTLTKNLSVISGLSSYVGKTVVFSSTEWVINRNNVSQTSYTKYDIFKVVDSSGRISPALSYDYDVTKLTVSVYDIDQPITIKGLNIHVIGTNATQMRHIVNNVRSNITYDELKIYTDNYSTSTSSYVGFATSTSCNVTLNNAIISGFAMMGTGYGAHVAYVSFVTFNNCHIHACRHGISSGYAKNVIINGGSYAGYDGSIDSHWGFDFIIKKVTVSGYLYYAGENIKISDNIFNMDTNVLLNIRPDASEIAGLVEISDNIINCSANYLSFYEYATSNFNFGRTCKNPDILLIKDNVVNLSNSANYVNLIRTSGLDSDVLVSHNQNQIGKLIAKDNITNASSIKVDIRKAAYLQTDGKIVLRNMDNVTISISDISTSFANIGMVIEVDNIIGFTCNMTPSVTRSGEVKNTKIVGNQTYAGSATVFNDGGTLAGQTLGGTINYTNCTIVNDTSLNISFDIIRNFKGCIFDVPTLNVSNFIGQANLQKSPTYLSDCKFTVRTVLSGSIVNKFKSGYYDNSVYKSDSVNIFNLPQFTADPTVGIYNGFTYYNTTSNIIKVYVNGAWKTVTVA